LNVKEKAEEFYFPLSEAPDTVRIDPDVTLLAKVSFNPPASMLDAQLADEEDVVGRLLAVEQLSGKQEALSKLKKALNHDPFYGVRLAAAASIRALRTDEALEVLLASTEQSDARVAGAQRGEEGRRPRVFAGAPRQQTEADRTRGHPRPGHPGRCQGHPCPREAHGGAEGQPGADRGRAGRDQPARHAETLRGRE